jgi:hypothetical protein
LNIVHYDADHSINQLFGIGVAHTPNRSSASAQQQERRDDLSLSRCRLLFSDPDVREGDGARVHLQSDETGIRVFALLSAAKFFNGIRGICSKLCGWLAVE